MDGELRELAVAVGEDGAFGEVEIAPSTAALVDRLAADGIELVDGQTAEICLALDDWIARATAPLRRGLVLLIDYGAIAAELYDPIRRRDGTLRAYVRHQVHDDPYRFVGRQDLTAHVDVTAVERAARRRPHHDRHHDPGRGADGLGIEERLREIQADPATTFEDYPLLRSALLRLLDPAAMGRFRFMVFGRDWPRARNSTCSAIDCRADRGDRPTRANAVLPRRGLGVRLTVVVARPHRHGGRDVNLHARSARRASRSGATKPPAGPPACPDPDQRPSSADAALLRRGVPQRLADACRDPFEGAPADRMAVRGGSTESRLPAASDRCPKEFDWNSSGTSWASPSPA